MDSNSSSNDVPLIAADGYRLAAKMWSPAGPARIAVLINPGAGIAARYYYRFAEFLATNGAAVLVYDYRGIGRSRPRNLAALETSVEEWGALDCTAGLHFLRAQFPTQPIVVVGHSVGGFLTGFTNAGSLIDRLLLVGAHTGYWRDYSKNKRLQMYLLWHIVMPLLTKIVGFFPGRALRVSEDIPAGPAIEWASRRHPDFWWNVRTDKGEIDSERIADALTRFRAIRAATLAMRFSDDPFATSDATTRVLALFSECEVKQVLVTPSEIGEGSIGHFGFFRSRFREKLWKAILPFMFASERSSQEASICTFTTNDPNTAHESPEPLPPHS